MIPPDQARPPHGRAIANWTIRPFAIDDYDAARALWEVSSGIGLDASDSRQGIEAFLARNPGLSSVAEREGVIVGAILCGHDGRRALVYHLVVADEHRRQGVGEALLTACLAKLREAGIGKCHILIFGHNREALLFWKQMGANERTDLVLCSMAANQ